MKKVLLTSMILLSTVSFGGNVYAQETSGTESSVTTPKQKSADVTFTADGNTLTISGYGDLTSCNITKDAKLFTSAAVGHLKETKSWTDVEEGTVYDSNKQYTDMTSWRVVDNESYFSEHSDYLKDGEANYKASELFASEFLSNNYTDVVFKNQSTTEPLVIDAPIIRAIMYPNGQANPTLVNLDLGEATVNEFDEKTFAPTEGELYIPGQLKIKNFTLPLTKFSEVYSEKEKKNVEKMVLPTKALGYFNVLSFENVIIPEGYNRLGTEAFSGCTNAKNFVFPTSLQVIGERAFYACNALRNLEFAEGLENIGKEAFAGNHLMSVKFPSTLKIINDAAFATEDQNLFIQNVKLNSGLEFIGNSAFALAHGYNGQSVIEIPTSVKYIGPYAFNFREFQDVYFYSAKAPLMPLGQSVFKSEWGNGSAFSEHTLDGNSGFTPSKKEGSLGDDVNSGYANRENYINGGAYFCILHYPKDLDETQRNTYTDVSRLYKTDPEMFKTDADERTFHYSDTGAEGGADVVGLEENDITFGHCDAYRRVTWGYQDTYLGTQYIWPSQTQYCRAYATASNGICWNGVDTYPSDKYPLELTEDEIATLAYAGYKLAEDNVTDKDNGVYSKEDLLKLAHVGTRQFVLANADVNVDDDEENDPTYPISMEGGKWWTICVPFNMTKAQVDKTFGEGTHVCRFNKVERLQDKSANKYLKLYFTNDVYVHKSTKDENGNYTTSTGTPVGDDDIVIYAHESYMIFPTLDNKDANNMYNISDYQLVTGSPVPTIVTANKDWKIVEGGTMRPMDEDDDVVDRTYRFVGNYQAQVIEAQSATEQNNGVATLAAKNVTVPQFSFIYAKKKGYSRYQFWFYYGTQMAWSPNKCVVQATAKSGGMSDAGNFYGLEQDGNGNWYKPNSQSAKKVSEQSFFGTEGETTGIDNVVIIAGDGNNSEVVYNLNGQVVNNKGNMDGLQKGIYIKNGKKYMVK